MIKHFLVYMAGVALAAAGSTTPQKIGASLAKSNAAPQIDETMASTAVGTGKKVVGYYPFWANLPVRNIPGNSLTHIVYAFANIDNTGRCVAGDVRTDTQTSFGNGDTCSCCAKGKYNAMYQLRKEYPHLQTILSVGGATWSSNFARFTSTAALRTTLASSCIKLQLDYGFDGLDVDWEFPNNGAEANQYLELLREIRAQWNVLVDGQRYYLGIATSADEDRLNFHPIAAMSQVLDAFHLMTYDFSVGFQRARHQASLYTASADPDPWPKGRYYTDHVVQQFIRLGAPKSKIVVGMPAYGHSFVVRPNDAGNGIFQFQTCGKDCQGAILYKDVRAKLASGGFQSFYDPVAVASWAYNARTGELISYDDVQTVEKKSEYINTLGLGGAMFWEVSQDTLDTTALIAACAKKLTGIDWAFRGPFCTKSSPFCNIRCVAGTSEEFAEAFNTERDQEILRIQKSEEGKIMLGMGVGGWVEKKDVVAVLEEEIPGDMPPSDDTHAVDGVDGGDTE